MPKISDDLWDMIVGVGLTIATLVGAVLFVFAMICAILAPFVLAIWLIVKLCS